MPVALPLEGPAVESEADVDGEPRLSISAESECVLGGLLPVALPLEGPAVEPEADVVGVAQDATSVSCAKRSLSSSSSSSCFNQSSSCH